MFRCTFDGPHEIPDLNIAAPVLHERYFMAPNPVPNFGGGTMPWITVGFEPGCKPEVEWEGQVVYELDPNASALEFRQTDRGPQPIGRTAVFRYVEV